MADVEYGDLRTPRDDVEALAVVAEPVDRVTLDRFPKLRLVANYGAGYDLVDVDACRERGVAVTNTPGVTAAATADLTMGLILAVRRRIAARPSRSLWQVGERLGRRAAQGRRGHGRHVSGSSASDERGEWSRSARGFEMRVLYTRSKRDDDPAYRPLDDLFAEADVVTLHVPLTDETRGFVDTRRLALMRDGARLVNTSRGSGRGRGCARRGAVSGRLRAGLDVFA